MRKSIFIFLLLTLHYGLFSQKIVPAFEEVIALQRPSNTIISPDGKHLAIKNHKYPRVSYPFYIKS